MIYRKSERSLPSLVRIVFGDSQDSTTLIHEVTRWLCRTSFTWRSKYQTDCTAERITLYCHGLLAVMLLINYLVGYGLLLRKTVVILTTTPRWR